MDNVERSKRKKIRKPHASASTSAFPYAVFAADATTDATIVTVPCDAVPSGATVAMPRTGCATDNVDSAVRMITEVFADVVPNVPIVVLASPLPADRRGSDALHRTVLGKSCAQPTTINTPPLWEHLVRFNQHRVSQGKAVPLRGSENHRQEAGPTVPAAVDRSQQQPVKDAPVVVPSKQVS